MYSFIETYFLTNENPYGRSLSFRRDTFYVYVYFIYDHYVLTMNPLFKPLPPALHSLYSSINIFNVYYCTSTVMFLR